MALRVSKTSKIAVLCLWAIEIDYFLEAPTGRRVLLGLFVFTEDFMRHWTVNIVRPYEREHWALWSWWIPSVRYGLRILGCEVSYECVL